MQDYNYYVVRQVKLGIIKTLQTRLSLIKMRGRAGKKGRDGVDYKISQ